MRTVRSRLIFAAVVGVGGLLVFPRANMAQEQPKHEFSLQGTGFFTKNSQGMGISQHSTDTGGFLVGYRYHFNRWLAAEANYGYARNTQRNATSTGEFDVQANVHEATAGIVVTPPIAFARLTPYFLSGSGALVLTPRANLGSLYLEPRDKPKRPLFTVAEWTMR